MIRRKRFPTSKLEWQGSKFYLVYPNLTRGRIFSQAGNELGASSFPAMNELTMLFPYTSFPAGNELILKLTKNTASDLNYFCIFDFIFDPNIDTCHFEEFNLWFRPLIFRNLSPLGMFQIGSSYDNKASSMWVILLVKSYLQCSDGNLQHNLILRIFIS